MPVKLQEHFHCKCEHLQVELCKNEASVSRLLNGLYLLDLIQCVEFRGMIDSVSSTWEVKLEAGGCRKRFSFISVPQSAPLMHITAFSCAASDSGFLIVWELYLRLCGC